MYVKRAAEERRPLLCGGVTDERRGLGARFALLLLLGFEQISIALRALALAASLPRVD